MEAYSINAKTRVQVRQNVDVLLDESLDSYLRFKNDRFLYNSFSVRRHTLSVTPWKQDPRKVWRVSTQPDEWKSTSASNSPHNARLFQKVFAFNVIDSHVVKVVIIRS